MSIFEEAKLFYEGAREGVKSAQPDLPKWDALDSWQHNLYMAGIMCYKKHLAVKPTANTNKPVAAGPTPEPLEVTSNTPMWFGKYQGIKLDNIPPAYFTWLDEQKWFKDKYPKLAAWVADNDRDLEE